MPVSILGSVQATFHLAPEQAHCEVAFALDGREVTRKMRSGTMLASWRSARAVGRAEGAGRHQPLSSEIELEEGSLVFPNSLLVESAVKRLAG